MLFGKFGNKNKSAGSAAPKYIIAGLGNPGAKYELTRHNVGFCFLDCFARKHGVQINKLKFKGLYADAQINGTRCILLKPQTFMNNSGESVSEAARFYKIPPQNIIVIFDDISLAVGKLRIRKKGTDGGHNGIKSVIYHLGSDEFPRIKIGVGEKPSPDYDLADWVLSKITEQERIITDKVIEKAAEAADCMVAGDIDLAISKYNG